MGKTHGKHFFAAIAAVLAMVLGGTAGAASAQSAGAAVAPPPPVTAHIQTADEWLSQDAGEYAQHYGVPVDEAMRRLRAQEESVATTDRLQDLYGDRLAGVYIEHRPAYRIVVLLTGSEPVPDQSVFAGGMTVPIVFKTGAPASRTRILSAITQHQAEIRAAVPHPPSMGVDSRTGQLILMVDGSDIDRIGKDALKARIEKIAGVPVRIRVQDRPEINLKDVNLVGGGGRVEGMNPLDGKRYSCTSGFVVTDGTHDGVVTAAHCPDTLAYYGPDRSQLPLKFLGQWGWGYQDVQLHVSEQALQPLFYADTKKTVARAVTAVRNRTSTRVGDVVCHRGERTGYSCAEVELVDFAPSGDLCGGACLATWVAVSGPTCKGGDSGAPVFNGSTAFGLVKGASYRSDGSCIFYFYMSTDYLPAGWSLLETPVAGAVGGGVLPAR